MEACGFCSVRRLLVVILIAISLWLVSLTERILIFVGESIDARLSHASNQNTTLRQWSPHIVIDGANSVANTTSAPSPPSIDQFNKDFETRNFSSFDDFLDSYEQFHALVLSGKSPRRDKFIQFVCNPGDICGGWGDRVKGIMNVAALAMVTRRAFLVREFSVNVPLTRYYKPSPIQWDYQPPGIASHTALCIDQACSCLDRAMGLQNKDSTFNWLDRQQLLIIHSNGQCYQHIPTISQLSNEVNRIHLVGNWQQRIYERYFKVTSEVTNAMTIVTGLGEGEMIKTNVPIIGIHVRSGLGKNDPTVRYSVPLETLLSSYMNCFDQLTRQFHVKASQVIVAADVDSVYQDLAKRVASRGFTVIATSKLGDIGHIARDKAHSIGFVTRMHAEFELLRRSKYIIVGDSGFSKMAVLTRTHLEVEHAFEGFHNCQPTNYL